MPPPLDSHDSLPYVDRQLTQSELDAAAHLIQSELSSEDTNATHPWISTTYEPLFSDLILSAHDCIASAGSARPKGAGIDLARYQEPSVPTVSSDRVAWHDALRTAYVSEVYLAERQLNLSLLDRFGRNAWLIANSQVEHDLQALEREIEDVKVQIENVEGERREKQDAVAGELEGLEESWQATIGRAIEAEMAGEALRMETLIKRRGG